jgi:hypothetical protein
MISLASRFIVLTILTVSLAALSAAQVSELERFQGEEAEDFLLNAKIVGMKRTDRGITLPHKATLERQLVRHFAIFKTIDVFKRGLTKLASGAVEVDFQDSRKTEVAAYELDKMIGLGMVPATVERWHAGDRGSMQWWIDDSMSESDRLKRNIPPPDIAVWNDHMYTMRLFDNLIFNVDRNASNMLITPDWEVCLIDHSRTFRPSKELWQETTLLRFSRTVLAGIEKLTEDGMKDRLGDYLSIGQIRTVRVRRDLILEKAAARIAEVGETRALFN